MSSITRMFEYITLILPAITVAGKVLAGVRNPFQKVCQPRLVFFDNADDILRNIVYAVIIELYVLHYPTMAPNKHLWILARTLFAVELMWLPEVAMKYPKNIRIIGLSEVAKEKRVSELIK